MKQERINLIHKDMAKLFEYHGLNQTEVLSFLMSMFAGTFVNAGYSKEFFDRTCEKMKEDFLIKSIKKDLAHDLGVNENDF